MPKIIHETINGERLYAIIWFDAIRGELKIGYSSRNKRMVKNWLRNCFANVAVADIKEQAKEK